jgi:peptide-methionine (S)-S-oxide reductase
METHYEVGTFGGGCFWCVEAIFEQVEGVVGVVSGYAGGHAPNPNYREVCAGKTGHAEVVQVTFDPGRVTYRSLVELFFATHDPTTPDRQGADVGSHYRSIILAHDPEQVAVARNVIEELDGTGVFDRPIVTEVTPLDRFYPAEAYHQEYFRSNPLQPYCQAVIAPKVAKLRRSYFDRLKA